MDGAFRRMTMEVVYCIQILLVFVAHVHSGIIREYCMLESFNATCRQDEVIVMESARYGRMSFGRCLKQDSRYRDELGCAADVLMFMDTRCSGRRSCQVRVPDIPLDGIKSPLPCQSGQLLSYLEAGYRCEKVVQLRPEECRFAGHHTVTPPGGYLASESVILDTSLTSSCPLKISASHGQRINFTLLDFSLFGLSHGSTIESGLCRRYALIKEGVGVRETPICGGQGRIRNVYVSDGSNVEIRLLNSRKEDEKAFFLIKYETLGCAPLKAPKGGYIQKTGESWVVGCNSTTQKWYLKCDGSKWIGQPGNCTIAGSDPDIWDVLTDDWSSPYGILVVVGLGVALGVVIGVLLLVLVLFWLRRTRWSKKQNQDQSPKSLGDSEAADAFNRNYQSTLQYHGNGEPNYGMWMAQRPLPPTHMDDNSTLKRDPRDFSVMEGTLRSDGTLAHTLTRQPHGSPHVYESPKFNRRDFNPLET